MPKKIAFSVSLLLIVVFVVLMLSRENIDFNNLSVEQLSKAGYYAYILPHEVQEEMNLTLRNIEMISFDFHCK